MTKEDINYLIVFGIIVFSLLGILYLNTSAQEGLTFNPDGEEIVNQSSSLSTEELFIQNLKNSFGSVYNWQDIQSNKIESDKLDYIIKLLEETYRSKCIIN